jgi:hypothetical protein
MIKTVREHAFYSYLSQFSTVLAVFGLDLTGKPATRTGWVDVGAGAGQAELPMGYPRQSLTRNSTFEFLGSHGSEVSSTSPFSSHIHFLSRCEVCNELVKGTKEKMRVHTNNFHCKNQAYGVKGE